MTNTLGAQSQTHIYRKVIVVGWDGADWRLLRPWMADGKLPTLAHLVSAGSAGVLRSTMRPESSVAWTSFGTGVNPGKHGIFGFAGRASANSYIMSLTNATSVRAQRFWDVLGKSYRVGLLNVPYTYPPAPVNGFVVGCMLTPNSESTFTYPPALKQELLDTFGSYLTDVEVPRNDKARLVENVQQFTDQQLRMALYLLQEKPWDFFAVVFTGPDRLQHFLWSDVDPTHPWHDPASPLQHTLLAHFQQLDAGLAQILMTAPPETLILLMSDHGFNGCARRFYVNHWLHAQGLLSLKGTSGLRSAGLQVAIRLNDIPLLRKIKRSVVADSIKLSDLRSTSFADQVNWQRTQVYFGLDGGLRINLRGREPQGIVAPGQEYDDLRHSLRKQLLALRAPETQTPVLSAVHFREELYSGTYIDLGPDLIIEPAREQPNLADNFLLDSAIHHNLSPIFGASTPYSGNHALDGIFCAAGPGICVDHTITGATIFDLAPTVLAAMGCAIPADVDGKPLAIFADPLLTQPSTETSTSATLVQADLSLEETAILEQRLRDLGYL